MSAAARHGSLPSHPTLSIAVPALTLPPPPYTNFDTSALRMNVCPYSCSDEFVVGALKGAFAGSLWGAYSFQRNLPSTSAVAATALAPATAARPAVIASAPSLSPAATIANNPLAMLLTSPRVKLVSPLFVYPVKFASLYSLYRFFSCSGCYISAASPTAASLPGSVLLSTASASLAGFIVSLPHLSPRLSLVHVVGCGGVGAVASVAQLGLQWLSDSTRTAPADSELEITMRPTPAPTDSRRDNG